MRKKKPFDLKAVGRLLSTILFHLTRLRLWALTCNHMDNKGIVVLRIVPSIYRPPLHWRQVIVQCPLWWILLNITLCCVHSLAYANQHYSPLHGLAKYITVMEKQNYNLSCGVTGNVTWKKDGNVIKPELTNIKQAHRGIYKCSNSSTSEAFNLTVLCEYIHVNLYM